MIISKDGEKAFDKIEHPFMTTAAGNLKHQLMKTKKSSNKSQLSLTK